MKLDAWNSKFCGKLSSVINARLAFQWRFHVISSVSGGRRKIGLLPEIGKIIVERVSNRPGVYTFRDAVEIQETICNKIIKKSIFDWHFYQNLKGFLQISKVSSFFVLPCFLPLPSLMGRIRQILIIVNSSTKFFISRFSARISRRFISFVIVLQDLSAFCWFSINF